MTFLEFSVEYGRVRTFDSVLFSPYTSSFFHCSDPSGPVELLGPFTSSVTRHKRFNIALFCVNFYREKRSAFASSTTTTTCMHTAPPFSGTDSQWEAEEGKDGAKAQGGRGETAHSPPGMKDTTTHNNMNN
jgi:hypothetical protein